MDAESAAWIPVGELAESFAPDSNILEASPDLAGRRIELAFADGEIVRLSFVGDRLLRRSSARSPAAESGTEHAYLATQPRPGIFLVDFVETGETTTTSVSLVLDFKKSAATAVIGRLPDAARSHQGLLGRAQKQQELTGVAVDICPASLGGSFKPQAPHHAPTRDLVGLRIRHRYNPRELYEHVYLNEERYAWHCIAGAERGLADVDRCHYYAIDDNLYLFIWREKIIPTLGVVLLDLDKLKTTGKIFGYKDHALTEFTNFPIGARSSIANRTPGGD
ncbi:Molybdenum cofactor biosynthesis protein F [Rhizobiales bacterium GAS188]|nr:Molybdenum cofactor biosynthesis protein F [Rhizobiales bacterium GAS188]